MRPVNHVFAVVALLCGCLVLAAPPEPPANETPADRSTEVTAHPMLCADVFDPDGDPLDVSFFGRRVTGEDFTIIALPDTQYYSETYPNIFDSQTQWIVDNRMRETSSLFPTLAT